jgi:hypothetical protein
MYQNTSQNLTLEAQSWCSHAGLSEIPVFTMSADRGQGIGFWGQVSNPWNRNIIHDPSGSIFQARFSGMPQQQLLELRIEVSKVLGTVLSPSALV